MKKAKRLWIFGNAVQDVTFEIDIDRLTREDPNTRNLIRLEDVPQVRVGAFMCTRVGGEDYAVPLSIVMRDKEPKTSHHGEFYNLRPGDKYSLGQDVKRPEDLSPEELESSFHIPCENVAWGGGGVNLATFLRALTPNSQTVPIVYTDIGMSRDVPQLATEYAAFQAKIVGQHRGKAKPKIRDVTHAFMSLMKRVYDDNPTLGEIVTQTLAGAAARFSPDHSLEVYLKSLPVDFLMYRPPHPKIRQNFVWSRIRSANQNIENKIIFRGKHPRLTRGHKRLISDLLKKDLLGQKPAIGAVIITSVRDRQLFQASFQIAKEAARASGDVVVIFGMTEAMHEFIDWLLRDMKKEVRLDKPLPRTVFVFNESEVWKFARRLRGGRGLKPFMRGPDDLPDLVKFAGIIRTIVRAFESKHAPRIYVTLGPQGSLGVDGAGDIVYVSTYAKAGAAIFDTNQCGDAFCAAISLLESSQEPTIYPEWIGPSEKRDAEKMAYMMAVATAAAYCKATNRRGRVDSTEVQYLLEYFPLGSQFLPNAEAIIQKASKRQHIHGLDRYYRVREPARWRIMGVSEGLARLMATG